MDVSFSSSFQRTFRKRIKDTTTESIFWAALEGFINDPFDARLRTHKLSGELKSLWSFSVQYDTRVVFFFTEDKPPKAVFVDIGTHDEVY
jgi:mRNA-degrading endonuclease YafQ of YafQ-DinJ toxin-antitoxin module